MISPAGNGIVSLRSPWSASETLERLQSIVASKGLATFALVDHSGEAEKAGLKMPFTKLLIFGSPKAGTPLMIASPSLAIDLPLKALVSEDTEGGVWLSWNTPEYLRDRHAIPEALVKNIAGVRVICEETVHKPA